MALTYSDEIKQIVNIKLPLLTYDFGNAEDFLQYLNRIHLDKTDYYIYSILSHHEQIKVITPVNYSHKLYKDSTITDSSTFIDLPYTVYNVENQPLYKVSEHGGIFGRSILDKILIKEAKTIDFYYVQYPTYTGVKTNLLVINKYMNFIKNRQLVNSYNSVNQEIVNESASINYLEFKVGNVRNIDYINLHFLKAAPNKIPSISDVIINPSTQITLYSSIKDSLVNYEPLVPGWLVITQGIGNYLRLINLEGVGLDRFIEAAPYLYYVVINEDIDPILLRRAFNINPNYSSSNSIKLKGSINI